MSEMVLFNIEVTEKNLMQAEYIFIVIAILAIVLFMILNVKSRLDYKNVINDINEKANTNKEILENAANTVLANANKIDDEWTRMKRDIQHGYEESQALYKNLKSVSDAFRAARAQAMNQEAPKDE